jgi:hypothetical protein
VAGAPDPLDLELLTSQAVRNRYLTLQERLAFGNTERKTDNEGERERKISRGKVTSGQPGIKRKAKQMEIRPLIVDNRDFNTNPLSTYSTKTHLDSNNLFHTAL